jgi:hypothetical protein
VCCPQARDYGDGLTFIHHDTSKWWQRQACDAEDQYYEFVAGDEELDDEIEAKLYNKRSKDGSHGDVFRVPSGPVLATMVTDASSPVSQIINT